MMRMLINTLYRNTFFNTIKSYGREEKFKKNGNQVREILYCQICYNFQQKQLYWLIAFRMGSQQMLFTICLLWTSCLVSWVLYEISLVLSLHLVTTFTYLPCLTDIQLDIQEDKLFLVTNKQNASTTSRGNGPPRYIEYILWCNNFRLITLPQG